MDRREKGNSSLSPRDDGSDEHSTVAAKWTLETVPTSIGHCHKIKIDAELVACVYVDHRDMRETDRRTLVAAERAALIASAPTMQAEIERLRESYTEAVTVLEEVIAMLRVHAPGTKLNNHRFDALGIKANAVILEHHNHATEA